MPVPSDRSAHHSLFSSLRHAFQPSSHQNPSAVAPDPPPPPSTPSTDHHSLQLYQTFESNLAQRLSSLCPADDSPCANIASLNQFLGALLATQADLAVLVPAHQYPLSQGQVRIMNEFLDRSIKFLDVCRIIKQQISVVESLQGMLQAVLCFLSTKNEAVLHQAQVVRARKVLAEMLLQVEADRGEEERPVCIYRSFRLRYRVSGPDAQDTDALLRRRSWQGRSSLSTSPLVSKLPDLSPARQLQEIFSGLPVPKLPTGDDEDFFGAAMYALNLIAIFFLGAVSASLPSPDRIYVPCCVPPRSASWARALLSLQERVQNEVQRRCKKSNSYAGLWELDQIVTIVSRLFDLTDNDDSEPGQADRDEIKTLVKQLKQLVEELDRDSCTLYSQLTDFYNSLICSRMDVLDKLSNLRP